MSYYARAAEMKAEPGSPLARARIAAHAAFDSLWKNGHMGRSEAYVWLAGQMDVHPNDCHIAFFDTEACDKVRALCDAEYFKRTFL